MSSPKYQKVETSSSDSQEEIAEGLAKEEMANIPSTQSSQQLMQHAESVQSVLTEEDVKSTRRSRQLESAGFGSVSSKEWFTVAVLCFINLINYMDRFTIAGECRYVLTHWVGLSVLHQHT